MVTAEYSLVEVFSVKLVTLSRSQSHNLTTPPERGPHVFVKPVASVSMITAILLKNFFIVIGLQIDRFGLVCYGHEFRQYEICSELELSALTVLILVRVEPEFYL